MSMFSPISISGARIFGLLIVLVFSSAGFAMGQDDPPNQTLPDIAPREIEIKGELEVSFPSLQRQPLVGFYPPPRIAELPRSRQPYVEEYKQNSVDLPASPLQRPQVPSITSFATSNSRYGELELAGGSYYSRLARIRIGQPIGEEITLHGAFDYNGSEGSNVFDVDPSILNPNDSFAGFAGIRYHGRSVSAGLTLDGFSDSYTLYALEQSSAYAYENPQRTAGGLGLTLELASGEAIDIPVAAKVRIGRASHESALLNGLLIIPPEFDMIEKRVDAEGSAALPLNATKLLIDATAGAANQDEGEPSATSTAYTKLAAGIAFSNRNVDLKLAPAFIASFFNPAVSSSGSSEKIIYLSGDVRASLAPSPQLTVYAKNEPTVSPAALSDLYLHSPYLQDQPVLQPVVLPFNAEGGVKFFLGDVTLRGFGGYKHSPNYLHFRSPFTVELLPDLQNGVIVADYDKADIFTAGAEFTAVMSKSLTVGASGKYQRGSLGEDNRDLAYFPRGLGSAYLTVAEGAWFFRLDGLVQSSTFADLAKQIELDPAGQIRWKARYNIISSIGLTLSGRHFLGSDVRYWDGYPVTNHTLMGGVRITW